MLTGKLLIAQGGGPTAVINQSVVGAVLEARKYPHVTGIYGAVQGVEGIINEDFIDLTMETVDNLEKVAATPSSGLLSTRIKPNDEDCQKMFEVIKAHDIRYFFNIGGNDSSETLRIIKTYAEKANYDLITMHIPKTVDNDLPENDHTPGFGSAARYVASAFASVNLDNRALKGVYIAVVMGRHAGFLTGASAAGRKYADDGPHLVYLPEIPFSVDSFLKDVKETFEKHGRCIIAVSEGIQDANGKTIVETLMSEVEADQHGNVQLSGSGALADALANEIKNKLGIARVRADTLGYLQRSFIECMSDVDQREAREVGEKGAQFALGKGMSGTVVMKRVGDYAVDFECMPVEVVAGKTKHMAKEFINEAGNNVTEEFIKYVKPLLGSGMKEGARFRAPKVEKILKK